MAYCHWKGTRTVQIMRIDQDRKLWEEVAGLKKPPREEAISLTNQTELPKKAQELKWQHAKKWNLLIYAIAVSDVKWPYLYSTCTWIKIHQDTSRYIKIHQELAPCSSTLYKTHAKHCQTQGQPRQQGLGGPSIWPARGCCQSIAFWMGP